MLENYYGMNPNFDLPFEDGTKEQPKQNSWPFQQQKGLPEQGFSLLTTIGLPS